MVTCEANREQKNKTNVYIFAYKIIFILFQPTKLVQNVAAFAMNTS